MRKERTGAPWNVFNYPLYSSFKAKCKAKAGDTSVTFQPVVTMLPETPVPAPHVVAITSTGANVLRERDKR